MTLDVSIIIKTFERPTYLDRLITSIKKYYPDIPILVADDSKNPVARADVEYYILPFDRGVSYGRNYLVDRVKTKYFITVDDDWEFTPKTQLENFIKIIESNNVDILVGSWTSAPSICVKYDLDDGVLTLTSIPPDEQNPHLQYCDFTNQFFITDTKKFKAFGGWDAKLKTRGEHAELFIRAMLRGLTTALTHDVQILHEHGIQGSQKYRTFRKRDFFGIAMKKHGIVKYINYNGKERKFD